MNKIVGIRRLSRPEEALRALEDRAPQAEAFAERSLEPVRPYLAWLYRARRRLATFGVLFLAGWLFLHVVFGANGMVVYKEKRAEYQGLRTEINGLQAENDRYAAQVRALQSDSRTIEREAREQLHYARPGEVVYVSPQPQARQLPATNAAQR